MILCPFDGNWCDPPTGGLIDCWRYCNEESKRKPDAPPIVIPPAMLAPRRTT